jgi:hypothetical protein
MVPDSGRWSQPFEDLKILVSAVHSGNSCPETADATSLYFAPRIIMGEAFDGIVRAGHRNREEGRIVWIQAIIDRLTVRTCRFARQVPLPSPVARERPRAAHVISAPS